MQAVQKQPRPRLSPQATGANSQSSSLTSPSVPSRLLIQTTGFYFNKLFYISRSLLAPFQNPACFYDSTYSFLTFSVPALLVLSLFCLLILLSSALDCFYVVLSLESLPQKPQGNVNLNTKLIWKENGSEFSVNIPFPNQFWILLANRDFYLFLVYPFL